MARTPAPKLPKLDAVALATKERAVALVLPEIGRHCKVCGVPSANPSGLCAAHQREVLTVKEEKELAKRRVEANASRYAELHVAGAEIAASRGDTRPAEWGLLHSRAVETVKGDDRGGGKVVVNIGMVLPGCGAPTVTVALPGSSDLEGEVVP